MLVLIAGVTGQLGSRLAAVAISRGLSVRGLGREPAKLGSDLSSKLESFVKSENYYDIPALEKAVSGVDAVLCAYSPQPVLDLDASLLLLRAAERANIKVFIASSWNNDWTTIKFGDFEHYDPHIAFEKQAAITSSIRPVYLFTGFFHNFLFTPYGPGNFDTSSGAPKMQYWGDGDKIKNPWSALQDVAVWTIEILINGKGVQEGEGGFFWIRSGEHTIHELAAEYEKATGTKVEVVRKGSLGQLEELVAQQRTEKGRARYFEYLHLGAALMVAKGVWEFADPTNLYHVWKPTPLHDLLKE